MGSRARAREPSCHRSCLRARARTSLAHIPPANLPASQTGRTFRRIFGRSLDRHFCSNSWRGRGRAAWSAQRDMSGCQGHVVARQICCGRDHSSAPKASFEYHVERHQGRSTRLQKRWTCLAIADSRCWPYGFSAFSFVGDMTITQQSSLLSNYASLPTFYMDLCTALVGHQKIAPFHRLTIFFWTGIDGCCSKGCHHSGLSGFRSPPSGLFAVVVFLCWCFGCDGTIFAVVAVIL